MIPTSQTRSSENCWYRLSNIGSRSPSSLTSSPFFLAVEESKYFWNLPNGGVQFEDPFPFLGIGSDTENVENNGQLSYFGDPVFLGSGGSGAVFSFSPKYASGGSDSNMNGKIAIKVSWKRSRSTVEKECQILRTLEKSGVPHVEKCIGPPNEYRYEDGRVMIALTPVVESPRGITSSIQYVDSGNAQQIAAKCVVETMVGMLRANIITVDVQPLIEMNTGKVLFIDFTEARNIFEGSDGSADAAGIVGFCSEMMALIPESLRDFTISYLKECVESVEMEGVVFGDAVKNVLESIWDD